MAQKPTEMYPC